ncbi:M20 peptidase aminoacylase family protein [Paenibacillus terreus]|uniref:M20 peptidase aminoacylase family protein n=1 Tax=Paenibacillus terreus TaxID=1387834 RepID=A0ABV5B6X7_9BACL
MPLLPEEYRATIKEVFAHLHANPEISMKEVNTTKYVKEWLDKLGCRTRTFDSCPGVIGEIGEGKPVVAVRADMDALWQEVNGEFRANHSCGHDAHMTMVIGAAIALTQMKDLPAGTIRFVFQPAEEIAQGALALIETGALSDIDYYYGVHLRPVQELPAGKAASSIRHGASRGVTGVIYGEEAHAARPHLGINAIEVASSIVQELGHIHLDPRIPYSVKMTTMHAGETRNIIPGTGRFTLDLRAQTNEAMTELVEKVQQTVNGVASRYGARIELEIAHGLAAAQVDATAENYMAAAIAEVIGQENTASALLTTGGDDFHQVAIKLPHVKATMLGLGCGLAPGLHHPHMSFEHDAMYTGIEILARVILNTLQNEAVTV